MYNDYKLHGSSFGSTLTYVRSHVLVFEYTSIHNLTCFNELYYIWSQIQIHAHVMGYRIHLATSIFSLKIRQFVYIHGATILRSCQ